MGCSSSTKPFLHSIIGRISSHIPTADLTMAENRPVKRFRFADDVVGSGVTKPTRKVSGKKADPREAAFKKARTDQFSEWRRGNYNWVEAERQAQIKATVHPKPGSWDPWDLTEPTADQLNAIGANRRIYGDTDPDPEDLRARRARAVARTAIEEEATTDLPQNFQPMGFKQGRTLGGSGHSVVYRFAMVDKDENRHNVVVKFNTRRGAYEEVGALKVRRYMRHSALSILRYPDPLLLLTIIVHEREKTHRPKASAAGHARSSAYSWSARTRQGRDTICNAATKTACTKPTHQPFERSKCGDIETRNTCYARRVEQCPGRRTTGSAC